MKKRILITGITGFVGSHLTEYLLKHRPGVQIFGLKRYRSDLSNISHLLPSISLLECDICDPVAVSASLGVSKPDWIFHLAAMSYVPFSFQSPHETINVNVQGTLNLLEGVRRHKLSSTKILIAGSSEEYGMVQEDELPIKETNLLRPLSPYAVSKVSADLLGWQYFKSYGLEIVRSRAFNHTGPRRNSVFVCSNFAKQIVEIERKLRKQEIHVGNLEAIRDFSDVRDIVAGYVLLLEKGEVGEVYNLSSGKGWRISEILESLLNLSTVEIKIVKDEERYRPSDVPVLVGDSSKIRNLGWKPKFFFQRTLSDLLNWWRGII